MQYELEELPTLALADQLHRIAAAKREHWVHHVLAGAVRLRQLHDRVGELEAQVAALGARLEAVPKPAEAPRAGRRRPVV